MKILFVFLFVVLIYSFNWFILNLVKLKKGDHHQWIVVQTASERKKVAEKYRYATPVSLQNLAAIVQTMTVPSAIGHLDLSVMTDTAIQKTLLIIRNVSAMIQNSSLLPEKASGRYLNSCLILITTPQNLYQPCCTTLNAHLHPP
jgi:hypothetical protein